MTKAEAKMVEVPTTPEMPTARNDPFDLSKLRLGQDYAETVGVKKLLRTVPVRKPGRQDFVRVHQDPAFRENLPAIELKEDRELYLIGGRDLASELAAEIMFVTLYTAINRQGVVFLWPVRLPNPDGREIEWHRSAREAAAERISLGQRRRTRPATMSCSSPSTPVPN